MTQFDYRTPLHVPRLHVFAEDGISYAVDGSAPNWVALDSRGREILDTLFLRRGITLGDLVAEYAARHSLEAGKAWVHVHDFAAALSRSGMLSAQPYKTMDYPGRSALVEPDGLSELWIQVNNACNLACTHCLVVSGPGKDPGLPYDQLEQIVDRAVGLGLERLYITGGEPFVRRDIFDLLHHATDNLGLEAIVLTNATVIRGRVKNEIDGLDRSLVRFQVSIDGTRAATNDPIRGAGSFDRAMEGARILSEGGFDVSLSTVVSEENLGELPALPEIAASVGAKSQHLMWAHKRGRAAASLNGFFPGVGRIVDAVMRTVETAESLGVGLDNLEAVKRRVNGVPGVKYDLGNGGWDSVAVYCDGKVYPTAALVNERPLLCGDLTGQDLSAVLETSAVIRRLRSSTLAGIPDMDSDPFRFFTGGGDWEHAYWSTGNLVGRDPYYDISLRLVRHVMTSLGREKDTRRNRRSGYDAPLVLHAMGEGAIACGTADGALAERPVLTLHSNCVLSFDVDKPRQKMREFYGEAAEKPQADLCCPTKYDEEAIAHIPQDVLDRFYGCGSPMTSAGIREGETVLDLGSGAGIDVFIAAKFVGPEGRAIGVDMTDQMLAVAEANKARVADELSYDVVDFRKGFLENIPVDDRSVDLVTSNCVVNLSPDKPRVFEEIWRVLKDHGRIVISDIVSEEEVPPHLKVNPQLWGECLVGALTQEQFLSQLERAGFYGLSVMKRTYWKEVEGYPFYSVTVQGFKFEKKDGCIFEGHRAVYLGPGKAFLDEEGHLFPRNEPYEICTDTVAKLSHPPYAGMFAILDPGEDYVSYACCEADGDCC